MSDALKRAKQIAKWNSGPDGVNDPGDVLDALVDLIAAVEGQLGEGQSQRDTSPETLRLRELLRDAAARRQSNGDTNA